MSVFLFKGRLKATPQDLKMWIEHVILGGRVTRKDVDDTHTFNLILEYQHLIPNHDPIWDVWGGIEVLEWSDGTCEITNMWVAPLGGWPGDPDTIQLERYQNLERISKAIGGKFELVSPTLALETQSACANQENTKLVVKLNRNDVFRQLLAMCNDGEDFSLMVLSEGYIEEKLECLTVADRRAITAEYPSTSKDKIIGFIRLLPHNCGTLIDFVHRNRPEWHNYPVINPDLWQSFIKSVFAYFGSAPTTSPEQPAPTTQINNNTVIIQGNNNGTIVAGNDNKLNTSK